MVDGFSGRYARYKTGLKPWGSQSGNTIPVVILLSYGFTYLRTKMPKTYTALKACRLVTFSRSPALQPCGHLGDLAKQPVHLYGNTLRKRAYGLSNPPC